jgi:hypothetical protein
VGEEGLHDGRVLHNGADLQPAATAENIEGEHAVHQRRPGPRTPGLATLGLAAAPPPRRPVPAA